MADSHEGVEFEFDGKTIRARAGQTVSGALHAEGEHILSRSFKYHRPRGLLCASGRCPNCLCTVNGTPNVRICTVPAEEGLVVKTQNAWPRVKFDLLSIFDRLHKFMPVGFYYKMMYKPRWMWPVWEKFIRRIAGLGNVDRRTGGEATYDKLNLFCDVAVVGGGWAGLSAAREAARAGMSVTLIDDQPELGGHLRFDPDLADAGLADVIRDVRENPAIQVWDRATVFGLYEGNYLGIQRGNRMIRLRAREVIVTTGGWERPLVFENNDLPGVLLASAAQRLLHLDHCTFEGDAVVVTDNAQGYRVARQLAAAGTNIAAIVDVRENPPASEFQVIKERTLARARGARHVTGAVVGRFSGQPQSTIPCRWIIQAVGFTPANSLLYQNGCKLRHDEARDHGIVKTYARGTQSAGTVNGHHDPAAAALDGRCAGLAAAAALRPNDSGLSASRDELAAKLAAWPAGEMTSRHYVSPAQAKKKFVCLCEDVTEKDVCDAIAEGYSNIETLKRYSTVSMGPCQGKMCQGACIAICARENQQSIEQTGVTTSRPPEQPLPLGLLAGRALHFSLVRRTPMHDWHLRNGATMMDAGNWKRPQVYTTVEQEYEAVRGRAGLVDVSTLGKIELRGRDVVKFLEFIYPNRFENLAVGRVRYGVICDDAGILLDDGTIARLDTERFFLTTTTGNADAIDSWFRSWLAGKPGLDVRLTNISGSYAAMNLAGPRSRDILRKLTDADVSTAAMPYLAARQCDVAGVPAIILRVGFVGELGYEIHVPSQFGVHIWEAIIEAGKEFSLVPFGVEAQRLLRLEKKHLLPGVDTDALSNPLEADLPWIVKLDKPDFVGQRSLARASARGPRNRLVGFRISGDQIPQPPALIMHEGKLGGRVTSCSFSPAAGCAVGLAWVPAAISHNGDRIQIQVDGQTIVAVVQDEPFYDPPGEKLKS
ncbi:MAG: FAD-dependent oxidoreductase [Planctomycetia bacterium]|nr:FAD-dependent oxidoreductase [Planctomycetia bacterium]